MIVSTVVRRSNLLKKNRQPHIIAGVLQLHMSSQKYDTHDYSAVDVLLPQDRHKAITSNQSILQLARKTSGAVVRWKKVDGEMVLDEDPVLVMGRPFQVKAATEVLLNGKKEKNDEQLEERSDGETKFVWNGYKRNFKGQYPPEKPRRSCIRCGGHRVSGNPCPLCQLQMKSNYNVHYTDVEILKQFICPHTWEIITPKVTGICRKQHRLLEAAIQKARDFGYLPFTLPLHGQEQKKHTPAGVPTDKKIKVKMH